MLLGNRAVSGKIRLALNPSEPQLMGNQGGVKNAAVRWWFRESEKERC